MSNSTELPSFSSLGPILKTTIKDSVEQGVVSSLTPDGKKIAAPSFFIEMVKSYMPPEDMAFKFKESYMSKDFVHFTGQLPARVDLVAKGIMKTVEAYSDFQKKFERLTDAEKAVLLKQLPENSPLRDIMSGRWEVICESFSHIADPESIVQIAKVGYVAAKTLAQLSQGLEAVGNYTLEEIFTLGKMIVSSSSEGAVSSEKVPHAVKQILSKGQEVTPVISKKIQTIWNKLVKETCDIVTEKVVPMVQENLQRQIGKHEGGIEWGLETFTNHFALLDETLKKIDSTLKDLPPRTLLATTFSSLDAFSQLTIQAKENCPEELLKDEESQQKFQIHYAAANNRLPTSAMNSAFSILCDPKTGEKSLRNRYFGVLNEALQKIPPSNKDVQEASEKAFSAFCEKQKLKGENPADLELIKSAFLIQYFNDSSKPENSSQTNPNCFLAEMVLLNPQDFLGDKEIQSEELMKKAGVLYVKQNLYPTIVQKFLPADYSDLVRGIGKLTGSDIEESVKNAIANAIIENGIAYLTDPQAISTVVLHVLGADIKQLSLPEGAQPGSRKKLEALFNSLATAGFAEALKEISVKQDTRTKEEIEQQSIHEVNDAADHMVNQYSILIKKILQKPAEALGKDVAALANRKDWGLCLLMYTHQLNQTLQDPTHAPKLDLTSPEAQIRLEHYMQNLYPEAAPLIHTLRKVVPHSLMANVWQGNQDWLQNLSYSDYIGSIENNLSLNHLTKRFMDELKFHSPQSLPAGLDETALSQGIKQTLDAQINEMVNKIWGVEASAPEAAEYRKDCIECLNQQPPGKLMAFIKEGNLRLEIINQKEAALKALTAEADALILHPIDLPSIHPFNLENIDKRLNELTVSDKTKGERNQLIEARKYLSLHMKMTKLQGSLSAIDKASNAGNQKDSQKVEEKTQALKALKEGFQANSLFQELNLARNQLSVLLADSSTDQTRIQAQQETVTQLEEKLKAAHQEYTQKEAELQQGLIPLSIARKMEFLRLRIEAADLEAQPEKNLNLQSQVLHSLKNCYREILNFDFGFGIDLGTKFLTQFAEFENMMQVSLSILETEKTTLEQQEDDLLPKKESAIKEQQQLAESVKALSIQNKHLLEEIQKLEEQDRLQESIWSNSEKRFDLENSLKTKQEKMDQLKATATPLLNRAWSGVMGMLIGKDPQLAALENEISVLEKEISVLTQQMNDYSELVKEAAVKLSADPYEAVLKRLENEFKTKDLIKIKSLYEERVVLEKAEKERLTQLNDTVQSLQKDLEKTEKLKKTHESQINKTVEKQAAIQTQGDCTKYLQSIDEKERSLQKKESLETQILKKTGFIARFWPKAMTGWWTQIKKSWSGRKTAPSNVQSINKNEQSLLEKNAPKTYVASIATEGFFTKLRKMMPKKYLQG